MAKKTAKAKQKPNLFKKLVKKATSTQRAMFVTGLIGILIFSGIGAFVIERSSAAVSPVAKEDCYSYLGRMWKNGSCSKTCSTYAGSLVVADPYDYCSKAASNISKSICDSKKRQFVYGVCAKEWNRQMGSTGYTVACKPHSLTYHVADPYDYCK